MLLRQKLTLVVGTSLIWITCLSSCAGLKITTWFNDGVAKKELLRKDSNGNITAEKSYIDADGYRCYSPVDDEAWRNRMAICCAGAK